MMKRYLLATATALGVCWALLVTIRVYAPTDPPSALWTASAEGGDAGAPHKLGAPNPVPACVVAGTVLTCSGQGTTNSWQAGGGNGYTVLTGTTTYGADGGPTTYNFTIPITSGADASTYTGVCNLDIIIQQTGYIFGGAPQAYLGFRMNVVMFNDGGGGVQIALSPPEGGGGGGYSGNQSGGYGGNPSLWAYGYGLTDAASAWSAVANWPIVPSVGITPGALTVTVQSHNETQCDAGVPCDGGTTYAWTLSYLQVCSN